MDNENAVIIRLFSIPPNQRTAADVAYLHGFLRTIEGLNVPGLTLAHRDAELRDLCRIGVHRRVPEDVLLYRAGDLCDCWYILLTGSVLIETSMFLPRACFGLRINGNPYRSSDCLVLEPSDVVMVSSYLKRYQAANVHCSSPSSHIHSFLPLRSVFMRFLFHAR
ncbi:rap guanine nucleotide exchange factor 6 [Fasciolopsis buskii]|uniref:Rap guanine nucleotide exchange factor 6 n=1 Tax=Fasciolopsis buskii TaxID=27845 RepID=A0A8E0RSI0_9TREM|nr:rap guanine nucleotide exchange factor 6 [Fasciolopsis buski]